MHKIVYTILTPIILLGLITSCASGRSSVPSVHSPIDGTAESWPVEGYNPGRTRSTSADITPPLQLQTEYQIGGDTQFGSPVVVADNTLFSEGERKLHAINLTDGTERWQINLAGAFLSPALYEDRLFVRAESGDNGYLYALNSESGAKLWEFKFPLVGSPYDNVGGHVTAPVVAEGLVLVGAARTLLALDAQDGSPVWAYEAERPLVSSAAVVGDAVYIADFTHVYALDLQSGAERWRFTHDAVTLYFAPVATAEQVLITSYDTAFALDAQSGDVRWSRRFDDVEIIPAAASPDLVFIKSANVLYALRAETGADAWRYSSLNYVSLPALSAQQMFVITRRDGGSQLRTLNLADGQESWHSADDNFANAAPVIAGNRVYVRTVDGRVQAFGE